MTALWCQGAVVGGRPSATLAVRGRAVVAPADGRPRAGRSGAGRCRGRSRIRLALLTDLVPLVQDEGEQREDHQRGQQVARVGEVLGRLGPVVADRVPDQGQRGHPDRGTDEVEEGKWCSWYLDQPGDQARESPDQRDYPRQRDGPGAPAVEEPLDPLDVLSGHEQVPAVSLDR